VTIFHRLGRALRFLREKRGKSQKDVAAAAGVTPPMLSAYENERTCPEVDTLDKILHLGLESTLADLCWALDVVNDRMPRTLPSSATSGHEEGRASHGSGRFDSPLRALLASESEGLSPALEDGYRQIVQGLLQISRVVYESVVNPPPDPDQDSG